MRTTTSMIEKLRLVSAIETSSTLLTLTGDFFRIEAADMKIELRNAASLMAVCFGARFEPAAKGFVFLAELVHEATNKSWVGFPDGGWDWESRPGETVFYMTVHVHPRIAKTPEAEFVGLGNDGFGPTDSFCRRNHRIYPNDDVRCDSGKPTLQKSATSLSRSLAGLTLGSRIVPPNPVVVA